MSQDGRITTKDRSGYARFTTQAHEAGFGLVPSSEPVRFSGLHSRVNGWCTRWQAEAVQDFLGGVRRMNGCKDSHVTLAPRAFQHI